MTYRTTIQIEAIQWTGNNLAEFVKLKTDNLGDPIYSIETYANFGMTLPNLRICFTIRKPIDLIPSEYLVYVPLLNMYYAMTEKDVSKFNPVTQDHLEL